MSSRDRVVEHAERVRSALGAVACSRSEAVALVALASGALVLLVLLWPASPARTAEAPPTDVASPAATEATERADADLNLSRPEPVAQEPPIVVHVSGLVARPGVYTLEAGARVADAIESAGGTLPGAQLDRLNLAGVLTDAEKVHVPRPDEEVPVTDDPGRAAWLPDGRLDVNKATVADLEELPGVGPVTAERIVTHREEVGGFASIGDLLEVRGIGEKTLAALADLLAV